jgi:hypothetical protein
MRHEPTRNRFQESFRRCDRPADLAGRADASSRGIARARGVPETVRTHFRSMKITQDVRDYAEAHRLDKVEDALAERMREKAAEFIKEGAEIYREV